MESASAGARPPRQSRAGLARSVTPLVVVLVLVLNLAQQPGLVTFDTKLDLQFDPAGFLSRSLDLWNRDSAVGGLQNQASGYLFPMGPVFWLGDALGVEMWVWQRLWSAAVMVLAYEGARRLAARWPGVGPWGAVVAGLAYMLAPRMLVTVGGLSGETLPAAVLPWTVLPLALYLRGRLRAPVAFVCSAATVPFMGGQNATLVVACLTLPALLLVLVAGRRLRRRIADLAGWGALVVLASVWWLGPLLLLGGYAPPFLDFIESADNTTGNIGWLSALRGTNHWVAFFPGGGSVGWAGGYELTSSSIVLVTSCAVALLGLIGLGLAGLWARQALLVAVVVGLAVLTLGDGGFAGSALAGSWRDLLDGSLAPLRNIHKFDPVVRLPLCLGLGALVSLALPRLATVRLPWVRRTVSGLPVVAGVGVVLTLLAATGPAFSGHLRAEDGMVGIPEPWQEAAAHLSALPGPVQALVLPGTGFAVQWWGRTVDEPLQVLDAPPWLARAQVTVAPAGTLRMLDSVERAVGRGRAQPGLADVLARVGITHVVVRRDLDLDATDAPSPSVVDAALLGSGLVPEAGFGGSEQDRPSVQILEVTAEARAASGADPRVRALPWSQRRLVQGGSEAVTDLVISGLLGPREPVVLATSDDDLGGGSDTFVDVLTDSNRRVERAFGRLHDATSAPMTADDEYRVSRPFHDYVGEALPTRTTVATYDGATAVVASSSRAYADVIGPVRPDDHPYAALDDSLLTAWRTAPLSDPEGQWIETRFDPPTVIPTASLWFDVEGGAKVSSVLLETDNGSVTTDVDATGRALEVDLPDGATTRVRATVLTTSGGPPQVRLANLDLASHDIRRSLALPGVAGADTSVLLTSEPPAPACLRTTVGVRCEATSPTQTIETLGFDRTVEVGEPVRWRIGGSAVPTGGAALFRLLDPSRPRDVRVVASGTREGSALLAPALAHDGRLDTGWQASELDPEPTLEISWQGRRRITGLGAFLRPGAPGTQPQAVFVDTGPDSGTGDEAQLVSLTGPDAGRMRPIRTDRLRLRLVAPLGATEPLGISELRVDGLDDRRYDPDPATRTGTACGFGPIVHIGGETLDTRLSGTLGDLTSGAAFTLQPCGREATGVDVGAGLQRIRVDNVAGYAVDRLWLEPSDAPPVTEREAESATEAARAEVTRWGPTERTVEVTASTETVLVVDESHNSGWRATYEGRLLEPVVIDGWKQGWKVPAGTSGSVRLEYAPQPGFLLSIVTGLVLAGLLVLMAIAALVLARVRPGLVVPGVPPAETVTTGPRTAWARHRVIVLGVATVGLAVLSVPLAVGFGLALLPRRTDLLRLGVVAALGVAAAVVASLIADNAVVIPPDSADALAALVVGALAGAAAPRTPDAEKSR